MSPPPVASDARELSAYESPEWQAIRKRPKIDYAEIGISDYILSSGLCRVSPGNHTKIADRTGSK